MAAPPSHVPPASEDAVRAAFLRAVGVSPRSLTLERLAVGFSHENWRVRDAGGRCWLVKLAARVLGAAQMENAVAAQRLAEAGGVRVPAIVAVELGGEPLGRPWLVQEWVDGVGADVALAGWRASERTAFGAALGHQVALLHSVSAAWVGTGVLPASRAEGWRPWVHWDAERLRAMNERCASLDAPTLSAAVAACHRLADAVDDRFTPSLIHRDLWPPNVVTSPGGGVAALLDFEHARFADPAWDHVKLDLLFLRHEPAVTASFRATYLSHHTWDEAFELRLRLCWGLELLRGLPYFRAESPNAGMAEMLDAELRRWLAR